MAGTTRLTEHSSLLHLAHLLGSASRISLYKPDDTAETIMDKLDLWHQLLRVAESSILRELGHIDWLYQTAVQEALDNAGRIIADERGYRSATDGEGRRYANDDDVLRFLTEPMPPALVLARVAEYLEVQPPAVVTRALEALHTPA